MKYYAKLWNCGYKTERVAASDEDVRRAKNSEYGITEWDDR